MRPMRFEVSPKAAALAIRLKVFMDEHIYPNEAVFRAQVDDGDRWQPTAIVEALKPKARAAGLWNLFLPESQYGAGLTNLEYAPLCEIMGRSPVFAPEVFNCSAPDTGNMEVLARYGTDEHRRRWLEPLLAGRIRSCFAMTEPDVASSDATNIRSSIVGDGSDYVINGRKWYISGAGDPRCTIAIFMGKTNPGAPRHQQQSMILVPMDTPGITIKRVLPVFGYDDAPHGHAEITFENVRVPASNVVGKVNEGWGVAITTLAHERDVLTMIRHISLRTALERLIALSKRTMRNGKPASKDPVLRQKIAGLQVAERCLQLNGYRSLTRILQGAHPGPEGSTSKLFWSQVDQELADVATEVIGPYSQIATPSALAPDDGQWEFYALLARGSGIRAGTSEILRNILGERVLGLPKD